jgi:hypothetical protein
MRMRSIAACAAALAASVSASYGGPCWDDISAVQASIDAVLETKAADGPPPTAEAMAGTSPQPTPHCEDIARFGPLSSPSMRHADHHPAPWRGQWLIQAYTQLRCS